MRFSEITGLSEIKQTLMGSSKKNHLAHAQLFYGVEGGAALPIALAFATYLLCQNKTENDSCGACSACHKMGKLVHPDVHFYFPTAGKKQDDKEKEKEEDPNVNNTLSIFRDYLLQNPYGNLAGWTSAADWENRQIQIKRDTARQILKTVSMTSFEAGYKILFIWYPEHLHPSAANALLKALEEPPKKTLYFLISYNHEELLRTIVSRTQLIVVPAHTEADIVEYLEGKYQMPPVNARKLAQSSDGSIGSALVQARESEENDLSFFRQWMVYCYKQQISSIMEHSDLFYTMPKMQQRNFLKYTLTIVRHTLLLKLTPDAMHFENEEKEFYEKFSKTVSINALNEIYQSVNVTMGELFRNANPKMAFFTLSIKVVNHIRMKDYEG